MAGRGEENKTFWKAARAGGAGERAGLASGKGGAQM